LAVDCQRTAIERPHMRKGASIANLNTLIYVLSNLRTLPRVRTRQASGAGAPHNRMPFQACRRQNRHFRAT
jgi:hypothetical protein